MDMDASPSQHGLRYVRKRTSFLLASVLCLSVVLAALLLGASTATFAGGSSLVGRLIGAATLLVIVAAFMAFPLLLLIELELRFDPDRGTIDKRYVFFGQTMRSRSCRARGVRLERKRSQGHASDGGGGSTTTIQVTAEGGSDDGAIMLSHTESLAFGIGTFPAREHA